MNRVEINGMNTKSNVECSTSMIPGTKAARDP
jgi:hypothetical protein